MQINPYGGIRVYALLDENVLFVKGLASALKVIKSLVLFTGQDNHLGKNLGQ